MITLILAIALTAPNHERAHAAPPPPSNEKFAAVHHTVKKPVHKPAKPHSK